MVFTSFIQQNILTVLTRTGRPSTVMYCLGTGPPMRLPDPAAAIITEMLRMAQFGLANIMRPAEVCSTLVTVVDTV